MEEEGRRKSGGHRTSQWKELVTCRCKLHQQAKLRSSTRLSQLAFDSEGRRLVVVDSNGEAYLFDLLSNRFVYKSIGYVGKCNFVEFNPIDNEAIILGMSTNEIKVVSLMVGRVGIMLTGHTSMAKRATFYREYCMTVSNKEAIVWCLKTCSKIHMLKMHCNYSNRNDSQTPLLLRIRTGAFSNLGVMSVLFDNNTIQCWQYGQFDQHVAKLTLSNEFGVENAKDVAFSANGRMMIVGGYSQVLVVDTQSWKDLTSLSLSIGLNVNKLVAIERPAAALVLALVLSDNSLQFIHLSLSSLSVEMRPYQLKCGAYCETMTRAKKIAAVPYDKRRQLLFAHIKTDGELIITDLKMMLTDEPNTRLHLHKSQHHLKHVQMAIKEELKLSRLVPILKEFGEYPQRHRPLIWSTIINLPHNEQAFSALKNTIVHQSLDSIKNYALAERSKAALLAIMVKCLTNWCALLQHCDFIHELVFPFIVVFQRNPILAFESSLTIILNFCQKWFEYHPLPPFNILAIVENMLLEADPQLLSFFCERQITSSDYAWPLLKTTFSEILSATDWLLLWDHLLTYGKPSILLCCAVAFNMCCRDVIMASMKTREDVQRFYSSQSQVQAKRLWKVAQNLDQLLPWKIHPKQYIRDQLIALPASEVYPPLPQLEYPKLLIEDFQLGRLEEIKKQKAMKREQERKAAQLAEKTRLQIESDHFKRQIQQSRFNELRKCYEELSKLSSRTNYATWNDDDYEGNDSCNYNSNNNNNNNNNNNKTLSRSSFWTNETKQESKFCSNMEQRVKQLELETSTLLVRSKI